MADSQYFGGCRMNHADLEESEQGAAAIYEVLFPHAEITGQGPISSASATNSDLQM